MKTRYYSSRESLVIGMHLYKGDYNAMQSITDGRFNEIYNNMVWRWVGGYENCIPNIVIRKGRITRLDLSKDMRFTQSKEKLKNLHSDVGNLEKLTRLDLAENEINDLPDSIGNLSELEYLDVSGNKLTTIPKSIGNLRSLRTLYLGRNEIEKLPNSIYGLIFLRCLDVHSNRLTYLPDMLGLKLLEKLTIFFNEIKHLPWTLTELGYLKEIRLSKKFLDYYERRKLRQLKRKGVKIHIFDP